MKILFVGGSFNDEGGKSSSVVTKFSNEIIKKTMLNLHYSMVVIFLKLKK